MIRTLFLQPLGPALILALSGLWLWFASWLAWRYALVHRAAAPWWGVRRLAAFLSIAVAALLWLRIEMSPSAHNLLWRWQPLTVAGATIHWRVDAWNGFIILLILLLTAVLILLDEETAPPMPIAGSFERTLWLAAAALVFVCSANILTVASSWLALDALLLLRLAPGGQSEPAGRVWGLLTLAAPLLLFVLAMLGESGLPAALAGGRFGRQELALLWLLGLIRAGVYPFHFWLTAPEAASAGARLAVHLLGPVTGMWFLARIQELAGVSLTRRPEWAALGILALLGSAMAAWLADLPSWRWRWIAINRASVILLAAYVAGAPGPAALAWPLVAFGLGGALLAVGQRTDMVDLRWPPLLGALILWGAPGTVGFLAHSALVFPTELALAAPLFAVVLVGEILLVAALWETVWSARPGAAAPRSQRKTRLGRLSISPGALACIGIATILLVVPAIAWGVYPQRLASLGGFTLPDGAATVGRVIAGARRSVWIGLVLSGLGGAVLGIWRRQIFSQMRGWQQIIGAIVGLEWLYRGLAAGLRLIGGGLQYFATLGEGEGYLGWLALAGLVLWVLIRG